MIILKKHQLTLEHKIHFTLLDKTLPDLVCSRRRSLKRQV